MVTLSELGANSANAGVISIVFHTVPLNCRTTFVFAGSLQSTTTLFTTSPKNPSELNWNGIVPAPPGKMVRFQFGMVVHPQEGWISRISSTSVSLNAVPSECEVYLDRRMVVGETEQTIRDEMERIIAGKKARWEIGTLHERTWTGEELTYEPFHLAWEISLQHELSRAFIESYQNLFGHAPEAFGFWDFSTNAVATVRLGIPTIGFGPGEGKLAHMRDEKCETAQIIEACAIYRDVISRL